MFKRYFVFFILLFLVSCEKDINLVPDATTQKLVVDAEIENGVAPTVILTQSTGYYSNLDSSVFNNSFIHNAQLTISNGTKTHLLKEYKVPVRGGFVYYYSNDPANPSTAFLGELGKQYTLKVNYGNTNYTAITQIPNLGKKMDSLWSMPIYPIADSQQVKLMTRVSDPPGLGNYIRYFTKQNAGPFLPGQNSVFDDQIVDGKTYSVQVDRGVNRNQPLERDNYGFFLKGDTVSVKFCNITKAGYDFWRTWEFAFSSVGNPFSSPGKVLGNVDNGALGAFTGYAAQYKTLIIPK